MIGIYFSGTGNTKHCVEKLVKLLDASAQSFPLEHTEIIQILIKHDIIVLGYPTQFSNAPVIVRDFIKNHSSLWNGKKVFADQNAGFRLRQQAAEENAGTEPGDRPSGRPKDRSCRAADKTRKLSPGRTVLLFPPEGAFWTAVMVLQQDG